MRALAGSKQGRRIAEIRASIGNVLEASEVQARLGKRVRRGQVARTTDGRWTLTEKGKEFVRTSRSATSRSPLLGDELPPVDDPGPPPTVQNGEMRLDPSQVPVVNAPVGARQIVRAGPGFGKTAVLCARVARLLDQGVEGANILVLSFTRTAVRELRARIRSLAAQPATAGFVDIRTLDSWAYRIYSQYQVAESPSYDASIQEAARRLSAPSSELRNFLEGYRHVFIDEAQDLVGERAKLVFHLLQILPAASGFTVFLDPAQAIYDWADENGSGRTLGRTFAELLRDLPQQPQEHALQVLHRTRGAELRRLLLGARELVLGNMVETPGAHLRQVLDKRTGERTCAGNDLVELAKRLDDESLILFRKRAEVLNSSNQLAWKGVPHRLRFGGLPGITAPWIAVLLYDAYMAVGRSVLTRQALQRAWEEIENRSFVEGWSFDQAWLLLRRMGRHPSKTSIDTGEVASAVATRRLPDEAMLKEIGLRGPVLGTVHGSKGREADHVVFQLPAALRSTEEDSQDSDDLQEARVLYVALTRAKERLELFREQHLYCGRLASGRVWSSERAPNAFRVEIGRENDLDPVRGLLVGSADQQSWLRRYNGDMREVKGLLNPDREWRWELVDVEASTKGHSNVIGVLSKEAANEIRLAAGRGKYLGKTNTELWFLRQMDLRTVGILPDHPLADQLPQPWRTLRLWLAPLVVGLGRTFRLGAKAR